MDSFIFSLAICGLFTGFIGALIGSNSLVAVPLLTVLGLSPHLSIATSQAGAFGAQVGSIIKFFRTGNIIWKYVLGLSIATLIGIIAGMTTVVSIDEETLKKIMGALILLIIPFLFVNKNSGVMEAKPSKRREIIGYFAAVFTSFLGAFGSGGGFLFTLICLYFFGMTMTQYVATNKIPGLFNSVISVIMFGMAGYFNLLYAIVFFATSSIGGYVAAHLSIKIDDIWLKRGLSVFILSMALWLLIF